MHRLRRTGLVAALLVAAVDPAWAALGDPISVDDPLTDDPDAGPFVDPIHEVEHTVDGLVYGQSVAVDGVVQDLVLSVYEPVGDASQFRPVIV